MVRSYPGQKLAYLLGKRPLGRSNISASNDGSKYDGYRCLGRPNSALTPTRRAWSLSLAALVTAPVIASLSLNTAKFTKEITHFLEHGHPKTVMGHCGIS